MNNDLSENEPNENKNPITDTLKPTDSTSKSFSMTDNFPIKPSRLSLTRNKLIVIGVVLVLLVGAGVYVLFTSQRQRGSTDSANRQNISIDKKNISTIDNTGFADKFIPAYNDMRGYAEHEGSNWYATFSSIIVTKDNSYRIYTTHRFNDLTSFTDICVHKGKIWIGGQGGLVRRNADDSFTNYLKDESNVKLFVDPYDNNLYVATFKNLFVYDEAKDTFVSIMIDDAPNSVKSLGFTKDHIVASRSNHSDNNIPVSVYDKKSKKWTTPSGLVYFKEGQRSSEVDLLQVGNQIIIYGRHAEYQSCEQHKIKPATVVYQFQQDGSFVEREALTELFKNNEANGYSFSRTALQTTMGCTEQEEAFVVDLEDRAGTVVASNKRKVQGPDGFSFYSFQDKVQQLQKTLGFGPYISLTHKSPTGSVFSNWAESDGTRSLYESQEVTQNTQKLANLSDSGITSYLKCADAQFGINFTGKMGGYGDPFLMSIIKIGNNGKVDTVYKTTNAPQYEGVTEEFGIANPEGVCIDKKIVLLGSSNLGIFNPAGNGFTKESLGGRTDMSLSKVNVKHDGFTYIDMEHKQVVRISNSVAGKKTVALPNSALSSLGEFPTMLFVANDKHIVIAQNNREKESTAVIVTFSAENGSVVQSTSTKQLIHTGSELDSKRFILQYENGETKLIDNESHKGSVISKEASLTKEGDITSSAVVKDPNTDFIVSGGYVWFSSQYWGVIGYKAQ